MGVKHVVAAGILGAGLGVIGVSPVSAEPVVVEDVVVALVGEVTFIDVLANDTADPSATLTIVSSSIDGAAVVVEVDGVTGINFTASNTVSPTSHGLPVSSPQSIEYEVCEGSVCDTGYVSVEQTSASPMLTGDVFEVAAGEDVLLDVYLNDAGFDGGRYQPIVVAGPDRGFAAPVGAWTDYYQVRYVAPFSAGPDSFVYEICNVFDACATGEVLINVTGSISTEDDRARLLPDTSSIIYYWPLNDPGFSNYGPTLSVIAGPSHGTGVAVDDSEGGWWILYTPTAGYLGPDELTYEACLVVAEGGPPPTCDTAVISIEVTTFGANDDFITSMQVGDTRSVDPTNNDLGDVDPLSITIVEQPVNGTVSVDQFGFIYIAAEAGDDFFTYQICDTPGTTCSEANVYIVEILPGPTPPVLSADVISVSGNGIDQFHDILGNDAGPFDPTTLEFVGGSLGYWRLGEHPTTGVPGLVYATSFGPGDGTDSFNYTVCNNEELCSTEFISVEISGVTNPVAAADDTVTIVVGEEQLIDVTANDTNAAAAVHDIVMTPELGTATVDESGQILYSTDTIGTTSLTYRVCDSPTPEFCDFAELTITVIDQVLEATDDTFIVSSGVATSLDVAANDEGFTSTDPITIVGAGAEHGAVTVSVLADESIEVGYTAALNFVGADTFDYQICSQALEGCATATVLLEVSIACTVTGTSGPDVLVGTSGPDVICGGGGADIITGLGGDDIIYGGGGADDIQGGGGNDVIYGGNGGDTIRGNAGADTIYGGGGADDLYGGGGNDEVRGGRGQDTIHGGGGGDTIRGGRGVDDLHGGLGDDMLYGGTDDDTIAGGQGNDLLFGRGGNDSLLGNAGEDTLRGGNGDDVLFGGGDADTLRGGGGQDTGDGGGGADSCFSIETATSC